MGYRIELTGAAGPGGARPADWGAAGAGSSLADALAQAERMVAEAGQALHATREKLRADPCGEVPSEVPSEVWGEVCEAGGAVIGARPGEGGASGRRLPEELAGFVESLRPKL